MVSPRRLAGVPGRDGRIRIDLERSRNRAKRYARRTQEACPQNRQLSPADIGPAADVEPGDRGRGRIAVRKLVAGARAGRATWRDHRDIDRPGRLRGDVATMDPSERTLKWSGNRTKVNRCGCREPASLDRGDCSARRAARGSGQTGHRGARGTGVGELRGRGHHGVPAGMTTVMGTVPLPSIRAYAVIWSSASTTQFVAATVPRSTAVAGPRSRTR